MTLTKDHIGGLVFLCLSVTYGYYTQDIPLLPGEEFEPFHPRTFPTFLAYLCGGLSLGLLVMGSRDPADQLSFSGLKFGLIFQLLALVVGFAIALEWVGFLVSTIFFLLTGFIMLGEKRLKVLLLAAIPFAVGLWFILTQLLDIYLAPGRLFSGLFGG